MKKGLDPKIQALHSPSSFAPRGNLRPALRSYGGQISYTDFDANYPSAFAPCDIRKTGASELRRTDFPQPKNRGKSGGADRDRTDGLLNAIQALSQLSYSPTSCNAKVYPISAPIATAAWSFFREQVHRGLGEQVGPETAQDPSPAVVGQVDALLHPQGELPAILLEIRHGAEVDVRRVVPLVGEILRLRHSAAQQQVHPHLPVGEVG